MLILKLHFVMQILVNLFNKLRKQKKEIKNDYLRTNFICYLTIIELSFVGLYYNVHVNILTSPLNALYLAL